MTNKRFIFLSDKFYKDYPGEQYPELEQKRNRPYIQIVIEINGVRYAAPLRSGIKHTYAFWTDKKNHCGIDFSKAVVISDEEYINSETVPYIRPNEFNALRGKDYKIKIKMIKYIEKYKKAKQDLNKRVNQNIVRYSTLQYFEKEIGIDFD